jgi:hypothetical protein
MFLRFLMAALAVTFVGWGAAPGVPGAPDHCPEVAGPDRPAPAEEAERAHVYLLDKLAKAGRDWEAQAPVAGKPYGRLPGRQRGAG